MKKKWLWYAIPIVIGGYLIYRKLTGGSKGEDAPPNVPKENDTKVISNGKGGGVSASAKYFPLKKGSKGAKVIELRKAILTYDSTLLPKFGADGDFGSETELALLKILDQRVVNSQQDIDEIIKRAAQRKSESATAQQVASTNSARANLSNKLIALAKGTNKDFYALVPTQIRQWNLTTDGRRKNEVTKTLSVRGRVGVDRDTQYVVDSEGWIVAKVDADLVKRFSPYGVEVH